MLNKEEMLDRLDSIYCKLEPIYDLDSADFANTIKSYEDIAALLIISFAFARAAPPREDYTDEEVTELERHADRLIELFRDTITD
ncbi:MAG: hypothetical protein LBL35_04745 [Clostridiales bacterium]|jgi:hypothetical protein|nr:hypothetical protein [Clostridiales bacterium]